jgi:Leucine-rich repeat (LRR) protein
MLVRLGLDGTEFNDEGIRSLQSLTNLAELTISNTKITSIGVDSLMGSKSLEYLDIANDVGVDDSAIESLCQMRKLKQIDVRWTGLSESGVRKLSRCNPALNLIY